ncbi:MAG TPA: alpha-amylase family glycosyl hydrolase, partial [Acidimicrobiales bacterium]|nr:alpha-amylase family glycosyl hydrolase [Acidimicrobiales bacterium]
MRFRVWAPDVDDVVLHVDGRDVSAETEDGGWWAAEADAAHGSRYGWRLDGSDPVPDPRSRWQPDGVHGLSAVDADPFAWTDEGWHGFHLPGAVLYELHVGTFCPEGTFDGVVERLPHLVELGVDAIELLPVAAFPGRHGWGYDGVFPHAVHDPYGGPAGLRRLVDAAHAAGIGVVMDVVHNHLGPDGNHLGRFGPYFSERHQTNWGAAVNLDGPGSDEVRRYFVDNALHWFAEYHIDALRLDAVHAILDRSARHLLDQLAGVPAFVLKPARGAMGNGILVLEQREGKLWRGARAWSREAFEYHAAGIISGLYSLAGHSDAAMVEEKLEVHPALAPLRNDGVP